MNKAKEVLVNLEDRLAPLYGQAEARSMGMLVLEDLFNITKKELVLNSPVAFNGDLLERAMERLLRYEPLQYVVGKAVFYGRPFHLQPGALIPRPETEELVALILQDYHGQLPRFLDIGVGSGCIVHTLSLELGTTGFGTDVSKEALAIAQRNAASLQSSVELTEHDVLLEELPFHSMDFIVSNPPYIPRQEKKAMHRNVVDFEPSVALFVPDDDPLLFYRKIGERSLKCLKNGGKLYFEIHEKYGIETVDCLVDLGYTHVTLHKDMQGKDRMVRAEFFA